MSALKSFRERLHGVAATQKITSAMRLIASMQFSKHQKIWAHMDEEWSALASIMAGTMPYMNMDRQSQKTLLIVFGADRGLCGGYTQELLRAHAAHVISGDKLITVGSRLSSLPASPVTQKSLLEKEAFKNFASSIAEEVYTGHWSSCRILYMRFDSVLTQTPVCESIWPYKTKDIAPSYFDIEPGFGAVRPIFMRYFISSLRRGFWSSLVSELAARMVSMDGATRNAEELMEFLHKSYHRVRQENITRELMEIVSGAELL